MRASRLSRVVKLYSILSIAFALLLTPAFAQFTNPYQRASTYGNNDLGFGDGFYTRYNNQYHGSYGNYGGPGNAYVRGNAFLNAAYSPGYTPRYGQLRIAGNDQYSPGFQPRYGVVQGGVNQQFAFSPGYTSERYSLPLGYNGPFQYSPGFTPRYGVMRIAAGGPEAVYPYTYGYAPRSLYAG
jgi:hypothetical protein